MKYKNEEEEKERKGHQPLLLCVCVESHRNHNDDGVYMLGGPLRRNGLVKGATGRE
jgi:hypothetical protein